MRLVEIVINCPDRDTATRIAERLVASRLVACANIGSGIDSIYRWRGAVERACEVPLLVKTRAAHFKAVAAEAAALHPWEEPAITSVEFVATPSYRDWVIAETEIETGPAG
jgi:periplasmic divalent cation tolerance protein